MGQVYSASFAGVTVLAGAPGIQDLFQIVPPADAIIVIHSITIGQESDAGDSEAEMLRVNLSKTDLTVNGSGGSTLTPVGHERGFAAAGAIVEANNTTLSTVQTLMQALPFNVQAGLFYQPTPEERIILSADILDGFVVNLPVGPADDLTMSGVIVFEEIGG